MSEVDAIFDFWVQATTPATENGARLVIGRSSFADALAAFGLEQDTAAIHDVADGTEWASAPGRGLGMSLGPDRLVRGLSLAHGAFAEAVTAAATYGASDGAGDFRVGAIVIRLGGRRLEWLASLPNFIESINVAARASAAVPVWRMDGTDYDKWLLFSLDLPHGSIRAEFRLKSYDSPYEDGAAQVDYFLTDLSIYA